MCGERVISDLLSCVYFFGFVIVLAFCNIVFVSFKFVFYCVILVFVYCTYICISRASGHSLDCVTRGLSVIHCLVYCFGFVIIFVLCNFAFVPFEFVFVLCNSSICKVYKCVFVKQQVVVLSVWREGYQ